MEKKATTSEEFDRFDSLVNRVLSVPKAQAQRIVEDTPASGKIPEERRLLDLRYLREELEREDARKSQVVHPAQDTPGKL